MPLSVLVGVFSTGKIFLFALCFITSESAATFDFMETYWTNCFSITAHVQKWYVVILLRHWPNELLLVKQRDKKLGWVSSIPCSYMNGMV